MDMHVHLFSDDEFPDALAEDEFKVMIAYGVTTIRFHDWHSGTIDPARKSARGEILAPTIFAASPHLTGKNNLTVIVVTTEAEGASRRRQVETRWVRLHQGNHVSRSGRLRSHRRRSEETEHT